MLLAGALREGYLLVVILAAINTAIAIYYYLSVVRVAYCSDPEERAIVSPSMLTSATSVFLLTIIVVMGVIPQRFVDYATTVVKSIM